MQEYFAGICIFICIGELLSGLLPSKKFEKLYRAVSGFFIIMLLLKPLKSGMEELEAYRADGYAGSFEEALREQDQAWDRGTDALFDILSEEEVRELLRERGYRVFADGEEE